MIDGFYHLHMDVFVNVSKRIVSTIGSKRSRDEINQMYLWHLRLGHIGEDRINKLEKHGLLNSLTSESYPICESFLQGKIAKLPFVGHGERSTEILALVHDAKIKLFSQVQENRTSSKFSEVRGRILRERNIYEII